MGCVMLGFPLTVGLRSSSSLHHHVRIVVVRPGGVLARRRVSSCTEQPRRRHSPVGGAGDGPQAIASFLLQAADPARKGGPPSVFVVETWKRAGDGWRL